MLTPTKLTSLTTPPGIVWPGASSSSPGRPMRTFSGRIPTQPRSESVCTRAVGTETSMPCIATVVMSAARLRTSPSMRLDWPRKLATKVLRGFS